MIFFLSYRICMEHWGYWLHGGGAFFGTGCFYSGSYTPIITRLFFLFDTRGIPFAEEKSTYVYIEVCIYS